MPTLDDRFNDYEAYHRTGANKISHAIGIPVIALALLGLGSKIPLLSLPGGLRLDLAIVLAALLVLVYLRMHPGLAIGIGLSFVPLYLLASLLPAVFLWPILAFGVGVQYVGHLVFEHNQPAFHNNAIHMLIGPLWVAAWLSHSVGRQRPSPADR